MLSSTNLCSVPSLQCNPNRHTGSQERASPQVSPRACTISL
jgi:hypothetical protein